MLLKAPVLALTWLAVVAALPMDATNPSILALGNMQSLNGRAAPAGCSAYDFPGWAKEAADKLMGRFSSSCQCFGTINWETYNGVEAMIDYIWGFGLKGTAYEQRIVNDLNTNALSPDRFKQTSVDSHDDALWGALMMMKMGDYYGQVKGDATKNNQYYNWALQIMQWVDDLRFDSPCSPGLYWQRPNHYQNTVVNGLYLHATLRMFDHTKDQQYLTSAKQLVTDFFDKFGLKNADGLYIDGLTQDGACKPGDSTTWTYNQGVMLSSFGMLFRATGDRQYIDRGNKLIIAVRNKLTRGGVLVEKCDDGSAANGGTCNNDQDGFKGVFMRHMQYFYDAVGRDDTLRDASGSWHTDWISLVARGVHQYARNSNADLGNIWYTPAGSQKVNGWTQISGLSAFLVATKWGTCTQG